MSLARRLKRGTAYKHHGCTKKNTTGGRRYTQQTIIMSNTDPIHSCTRNCTKTIIHDSTKR